MDVKEQNVPNRQLCFWAMLLGSSPRDANTLGRDQRFLEIV
jgi:hypothetical protein